MAAASLRNLGRSLRRSRLSSLNSVDCGPVLGRVSGQGRSRSAVAKSIKTIFEALETRQLMSVIPAPIVSGWQSISGAASTDSATYNTAPFTAVDPLNPNRAVTVYTHNDPTSTGNQKLFIQYAYTSDGGANWSTLHNLPGNISDPQLSATSNVPYAQATDATVSFDRTGSFYVGYAEHNVGNSGGAIIIQGYNWTSGSAPVAMTTAASRQVVYQWVGADSAWSPTLAVDNNLPLYTDPTTSNVQEDDFSGTIYMAWATQDVNSTTSPLPIQTFNPNTVRVVSAVWDDVTTKTTLYTSSPEIWNVNGHAGTVHAATPKIVISQGSALVSGGQVSVVWDDINSGRTGSPPVDNINVSTSTTGGGATYFDNTTTTPVIDAQNLYFTYPTNPTTNTNITATPAHTAVRADGVTVNDFDGNGKSDVVIFNNATHRLAYLAGTGIGTFNQVGASILYAPGMGVVTAIVSGRFDGDSTLDLFVIDPSGAWLYTGNGNGTFNVPTSVTIPQAGLTGAVAADLDGDSDNDLILTDVTNKQLFIGINDGAGNFALTTVSTGTVVPDAVTAGDFDGDGAIDLIVLDKAANAVSFLKGAGTGAFAAPAAPISLAAMGITSPKAIVAGDFDGDGDLDLAVIDAVGAWVLTGNGDGTFNAPTGPALTQAGLTSAGAADLDGDGDLDLLLSNTTNNELVGALNGGTNTTYKTSTASTTETPSVVVVGDFDTDGVSDMLVLDKTAKTLSFHVGNGDGTFAAASVTIALPAAVVSPTSVVTGDFNGDGKLDAALVDASGVWIYTGNGDGTFNTPGARAITQAGLSAVVTGDLDGDGDLDLVLADTANKRLFVALNNGSGVFTTSIVSMGTNVPNALAIGDFDNDTKLDVVAFDTVANKVIFLNGDGAGGLTLTPGIALGTSVTGPVAATAGDFNGDGLDDVAFADSRGVWVLYGNGTFLNPVATTGRQITQTGITSLAADDLDGDGDDDVIGSNAAAKQVVVGLVNGTGTNFTAISNSASGASMVVTDDFDGGKADAIVVNSVTDTLSFLHGNGDGTFRTAPTIPQIDLSAYLLVNPRYMAVGDFDGDTKNDLVIVDDKGVWMFLGNGDGTFQAPNEVIAQSGLGRIYTRSSDAAQTAGTNAYVDFNGDNKGDFIVVDPTHNQVIVALSSNNWAGTAYSSGGNLPIAAAIADFNKDGKLDIVVANNGDGSVGFLINQGLGVFADPSTATNTILSAVSAANPTPNLQDIAVGNVDADTGTRNDIVVLGDHQLFTFFNRFNGSFAFTATAVVAQGNNSATGLQDHFQSLQLFDVDGDSKLDAVIANDGVNNTSGSPVAANNVTFMSGNNAGGFVAPTLGKFLTGTTPNQGSSHPQFLTLQDMDGNGQLDVIVVNANESDITVLLRPTTPAVSPITTSVSVTVGALATGFSLSDIAVDIGVLDDNPGELLVTVKAPNGNTVVLIQNRLTPLGTRNWTPTNPMGVAGTDLGYVIAGNSHNLVGLTFGNGVRNVNDGSYTGVGTYLPEGNTFRSTQTLMELLGYNAGDDASGAWTLNVTDNVTGGSSTITHFGVRLTSNTTVEAQNDIASTHVLGALDPSNNPLAAKVAGSTGVGPGIQVASDNTLGSFSANQGRIYVTFVDRSTATNNPADNTDVMLTYSDDGGLNWSQPTRVNDDNAATDGYSEAVAISSADITTRGRPQFQPAIAVDQFTGTLVISYFDARQDAARTRVARYIATSIDGGNTFGPQSYLNIPYTAVDASTGKTVTLGATPDNGTQNVDPNWGVGYEQGLAVLNGNVYATWSGNNNGSFFTPNGDGTYTWTVNAKHLPDIQTAVTRITAGPRVVSGTSGPVSQPGDLLNPSATDGTPTLSSFVLTFDRPIDLSTVISTGGTIGGQNVWVYYRAPGASGNAAGTEVALNAIVVAIDPITHVELPFVAGMSATAIRLDFATPQTAPGTYSYYVEPTVSDRVRKPYAQTLTHQVVTFGSDPANSNLALPSSGTGGQGTAADITTSTIKVSDIPVTANEQLTDITINVNILHTRVGDLQLTLIDPDGNRYLLRQFSGTGRNIADTYTSSDATSTVDDLAPLLAGLNAGTITAAGNWKLEVLDNQSGDAGFLTDWNITVSSSIAVGADGNLMDQDGNGVGGENAWSGVSLGDFYSAPGATQANAWDASTHTFHTPYSSTTLPIIISGPSVTTGDKTYASNGATVVIPDAVSPTTAGTASSTITVTGATNQVIDSITVKVVLNHASLDTLTAYLQAPDGTRVLLMLADPTITDPIDGTFSPVTIFDDTATTNIAAATSVSRLGVTDGVFAPAGAVLVGHGLSLLNGKAVNGTWTLIVNDTQPDGLTGTIESWAMSVDTSTVIVNPTPTTAGTQPTVNSVVVTFDRTMDVAQMTTPGSIAGTVSPILRIVGPAGPIDFAPTYKSTDIPKAIPDTNTAITSTLKVTDDYKIGHVTVKFDIAHLNVGDLVISLVDPNGVAHTLVTNRGGTGDNFTGTLIDDLSATAIAAGVAPFSSAAGYQSEGSSLASLVGTTAKGTWTLRVTDSNGNAIAGTLNSWSMSVTPQIVAVTAGDPAFDPTYTVPGRTFRIYIPNQSVSGQYGITLSPSLKDAAGNMLDSDHNAGVAALRDAVLANSNAASPTVPYNYSSSTAVTIPAATSTTVPSVTTSILTVPDNYTLQGLTAKLNITFANDPSLDIVLESPTGQQVILFSNGTGNFGTKANFTNTIFDDAATTPIQSGGAPYAGRFNPKQPLADIVGLGTNVAGDWKLIITNHSTTAAAGTLNGWSITTAKTTPTTGMGTAADQATVNFRIFNLSGSNTQSSNTWTPVTGSSTSVGAGAAAASTVGPYQTLTTGSITDVAVDPSDSSGNTVFVATASGGIWKTTNFLTSDPQGPVYVPVTDFGAINSLNVGSLAVFAQGSQPGASAQLSGTVLTATDPTAPSSPAANGLSLANVFDGSFNTYYQSTLTSNASVVYDLGSSKYVTSVKYAPRSAVQAQTFGSLMVGGKFQGTNNPAGGWTDLVTITAAPASGVLTTASVTNPNYYRYVRYVGPAGSASTIAEMQVFGAAANTVSAGSSNKTVIVAGTGQGDAGNTRVSVAANSPVLTSPGVGFLISLDGGANWNLFDSTTNVDPVTGAILASNSPLRDHKFVGTSTFKVVVDPRATTTGETIIYAALTGTNGGLWRSLDTGKHWTLMRAGDATDVILDYASGTVNTVSNPTGNLNTIYAGFRGEGIFQSPNRGATWNQLLGNVGGTPLVRDGTIANNPALKESTSPDPNGNKGRIVLAMPAPTGDAAADTLHEGWIYAGVVQADATDDDGKLDGLYVTKDFGQNWTKISLAKITGTVFAPTNDPSTGATFNIVDGTGVPAGTGSQNFSIAVDPNNPSVVYVGGSSKATGWGIVRVDTTRVYDAHAFYTPVDASDGGKLSLNVNAAVNTKDLTTIAIRNPFGDLDVPTFPSPQYLNLVRDPLNPFVNNGTYLVANATGFVNSGSDAYWNPIDDLFSMPEEAIFPNAQRVMTMIDPLTGLTRILYANDSGVYSAVTNADGSLAADVGTAGLANGSRNGNIAATQVIQGAMQPGSLAAQLAGAYFYAMTASNGVAVSSTDILTTGNTTGSTNFNGAYGTGLATDQTGSGTAYADFIPGFFGSDFFQVFTPGTSTGNTSPFFYTLFSNNGGSVGRTQGLINDTNAPAPATDTGDSQWPDTASFPIAANPVNGNQLLIGSWTGAVYESNNQGIFWSRIGAGSDLDNSIINAFAFGAPDQSAGDSTSNLIYAGTSGIIGQVAGSTATGNGRGQVFVSFTGGGSSGGNAWTSLDPTGLDGSAVKSITANPTRGSHELYVVTEKGVYWMANSAATNAKWTKVTNNLPVTTGTTAIWTSVVADWRYQIPNATITGTSIGTPTNTGTHPILYVAGDNGVYRSLDNGTTWKAFPSQDPTLDSAPVDGGYLPHARVTDLDLGIGNINPTTGFSDVSTGPSILLASTYGRGQFAIRVAPLVFNAKFGADTSLGQRTITGLSQLNAYGNSMGFNVYNTSDPTNPIAITPDDVTLNADGTFTITLPAGLTATKVSFQAVDAAGVIGPMSQVLVPPTTPGAVNLQAASDSGVSNTDNLTNVRKPTVDDGGTLVGANNTVTVYLGGVSTGTTVADGTGHWAFTFPTNLVDGTYNVTITQTDATNQTSAQSPALVMIVDGTAPTVTPHAIAAVTKGVAMPATNIATIVDAHQVVSATINWGDGTPAQTITNPSPADGATWNLTTTHTYANAGNFTVSVTTIDNAGNTSVAASTPVAVSAPPHTFDVIPVASTAITPQENSPFTARVAIVQDSISTHTAADVTALINWGDGTTPTLGTIQPNTDGTGRWNVLGTHTYIDNRQDLPSYNITVTVTTVDADSKTITSLGNVSNVAPTGTVSTPAAIYLGQSVSLALAASDVSPTDLAAGFKYVINWGDGSTNTTILRAAGNGSGVSVPHTFNSVSSLVTVTIEDKDGGQTVITKPVTVKTAPALNSSSINGNASRSDINLINFNVSNTDIAGGISLSNLKLYYNGDGVNALSLAGAALTFDPASGNGTLNLQGLTTPLKDGDYQLQISVGGKLFVISFFRLAGDVNGDGKVDAKDQAIINKGLGHSTGQTGYNAAADLNHDGVVNAADVALYNKWKNHKAAGAAATLTLQTGKTGTIPTIDFGKVAKNTNGGYIDLVVKNTNANGVMLDVGKVSLAGAGFSFALPGAAWGPNAGAVTTTIAPGKSTTIRVYLKTAANAKALTAKLKFSFATISQRDYKDVTVPVKATITA